MADEFAPGIPSKDTMHSIPEIKEPEAWEYTVHSHKAKKAGKHYDLRLGDPKTKFAHSWSIRNWPKPGMRVLAVQQPTHSMEYLNFKGEIKDGYGAGAVDIEDRDNIEIVRSTPDKVHFNVYKGKGPQEYSLIRMKDKNWLLMNRTIDRQRVKDAPTSKPKYRKVDSVDFENDEEVMQAKIDGAHNLILFPSFGLHPKFISYRPGKRSEVIEHSQKVPGIFEMPIPKRLRGTVLRGEMFATDSTGHAIQSTDLGGILNSNVWKSRASQEGGKMPLRTVLFDVVQYKGKNYEDRPYEEKLRVLEDVASEIRYFELPRMARTPEEKRKLFDDIKNGKVPETKEGVIAWNMVRPGPPAKYKFRPDYDVYIRGFFDATPGSKYEGSAVGGFSYSHTPNGPIVGRIGTGLSDELRKKMYKDPRKYIGSVAKVTALGVYPSAKGEEDEEGALRSPSFSEWHLDKNDVAFLKAASMPLDMMIGHIIEDMS